MEVVTKIAEKGVGSQVRWVEGVPIVGRKVILDVQISNITVYFAQLKARIFTFKRLNFVTDLHCHVCV